MKPYYYVYRVNDRGPRVRHSTLDSAHTEALRLAAQHPGESFEILQCLATVRTTSPQAFWMDGVIPPHICAFSKDMAGRCFVCGHNSANVRDHRNRTDGATDAGEERASASGVTAGRCSVHRSVGPSLCSHKSSDYEFVSIGGSCNLSPHSSAVETIEWEHRSPSCIHFSGTESCLAPDANLRSK